MNLRSQPHRKYASLAGLALYGDLPASHVQDAFHQRQAEAVALGGVRGIALVKLIEDVLDRFGRNPAAGISDGDNGIAVVLFQRSKNRSARLRELKRIGEQIVPDQGQQFFVGINDHAVFNIRFDLDLLILPDRFKAQQTFRKLSAQVKGHLGRADPLVFQAVQAKNIGDQRIQANCRAVDRLGVVLSLLLRQRIGLQELRKWAS